jgi:hypothetical protein
MPRTQRPARPRPPTLRWSQVARSGLPLLGGFLFGEIWAPQENTARYRTFAKAVLKHAASNEHMIKL